MCVYTTVMGIAYSMGEVVHINVSMTIYIYTHTYNISKRILEFRKIAQQDGRLS